MPQVPCRSPESCASSIRILGGTRGRDKLIATFRIFAAYAWSRAHRGSPFHSIHEWSERFSYYIPATLQEIGLCIGFSHGGGTCPRPRPERLEAITVTGIKTVNVDFCTCPTAGSDDDQIKAHRWWPLGSNLFR
ncbi:hypothetical protein B0H14DRAFT_2650968 [Mycena olivaceomarginata]|nr:hypothetical protein B0H14DRAFT_2650968 [Mycena olivaceomarginata]